MSGQDAIALLREDHTRARALFKEFFATTGRAHAARRRIADRIIAELSVHAGIEEAVLYPQARAGVPDTGTDVLEALEEHHIVKATCAELRDLDTHDECFAPKMQVLMENVTHHMREEERDLFPRLRRALSPGELLAMGEDLRSARAAVPKTPHPHAPDEPPGNLAVNAVAVPVEAAVRSLTQAVRRGRRGVTGH